MGMKHLLTSIKHECQDYLREWEKHYPERVEFVIRCLVCICGGIFGGLIVGLLFWSAAVGYWWALASAIGLMMFLPSD